MGWPLPTCLGLCHVADKGHLTEFPPQAWGRGLLSLFTDQGPKSLGSAATPLTSGVAESECDTETCPLPSSFLLHRPSCGLPVRSAGKERKPEEKGTD